MFDIRDHGGIFGGSIKDDYSLKLPKLVKSSAYKSMQYIDNYPYYCDDNNCIYYYANAYDYLYRYDINADSWSQLTTGSGGSLSGGDRKAYNFLKLYTNYVNVGIQDIMELDNGMYVVLTRNKHIKLLNNEFGDIVTLSNIPTYYSTLYSTIVDVIYTDANNFTVILCEIMNGNGYPNYANYYKMVYSNGTLTNQILSSNYYSTKDRYTGIYPSGYDDCYLFFGVVQQGNSGTFLWTLSYLKKDLSSTGKIADISWPSAVYSNSTSLLEGDNLINGSLQDADSSSIINSFSANIATTKTGTLLFSYDVAAKRQLSLIVAAKTNTSISKYIFENNIAKGWYPQANTSGYAITAWSLGFTEGIINTRLPIIFSPRKIAQSSYFGFCNMMYKKTNMFKRYQKSPSMYMLEYYDQSSSNRYAAIHTFQ